MFPLFGFNINVKTANEVTYRRYTMSDTKPVSFMAACKAFFGLLPDQQPLSFGKELQRLTNEDRTEIAAGLAANGYNIDPTTIEKKAVTQAA